MSGWRGTVAARGRVKSRREPDSERQLVLVLQLPQNQQGPIRTDLSVGSQLCAGEIGERLHFPNPDREQVVDLTGELGALNDLSTSDHPAFEGRHFGAGCVDQHYLDERHDREARARGAEQGRVSANDAGRLQSTHPAHAGRGGCSQFPCEIPQAAAIVLLEQSEEMPVGCIEAGVPGVGFRWASGDRAPGVTSF
jgi:hypothetical protein